MNLTKLIGAAVLCAVSAGFAGCSGGSDNDPYSRIDYLAVRTGDDTNWSLYGPGGEIKFPEEFKERPSCVIEGLFSVKEGEGYTLYKATDKCEPVKDAEGLYAVGFMSDGLIPVTHKKERISVINKSGEKKFSLDPVKGKEIVSCEAGFCEGMMMIQTEDELYGYINTKGEVVITPKYNDANSFAEGLAVVSTKDKEGEEKYLVIDKKGETVFTFRQGMRPVNYTYESGMLVARDANDHYVLLDTKGEVAFKCPSKVEGVGQYDNKYMVWRADDGQWGIMDLEGNVLVRPKYNSIAIMGGDKFLANNDERAVVINTDGEESLRIEDYDRVIWAGKFSFVAFDKKTVMFLDKEGKMFKNAEFHTAYDSWAPSRWVRSDFFNTAAVVSDVCSMINDKGVDKYVIGEGPGAHFSNPSDYTYRSNVSIPDLDKKGYRYSISTSAYFSSSMADYDYSFNGYDYIRKDYWRPGCELSQIAISINTETDWGNSGSEAIVEQLKKDGFKVEAMTNKDTTTFMALLHKGNILVAVQSNKGAYSGSVVVAKYEKDVAKMLTDNINQINSSESSTKSPSHDADVAVVEEVVADDTVAIVDASYY